MFLLASNPVFAAYRESDLFGKLIFISLFLLSILTWVIFLQKFLMHKEAKKKATLIWETFQKKRFHPLGCDFSSYSHPFTELYRTLKQQTIELLSKNKSAVKEEEKIYLSRSDIDLIRAYLMTTISQETKVYEKNLFVLSTVVSLAPFLGLLGTVWGILLTFSELQAGGAASANAMIMGGLAMALGTTVLGLVVAIPALIGYNYLKASIAHFSQEMEDFSLLLVASVEMQYRKVDVV